MNKIINLPSTSAALVQHLHQPAPRVLWHYTSLEACRSILITQKIWASDFRFLNDSSEFKHFVEIHQTTISEILNHNVKTFFSSQADFQTLKLAAEERDREFRRLFGYEDDTAFLVASFSEGQDQLGQWRGYTRGATGVSIGFDLGSLRQMWEQAGIDFAPCVYTSNDKGALLRGILGRHLEVKRRNREEILSFYKVWPDSPESRRIEEIETEERQSENRLREDFAKARYFTKKEEFSEEREWRVVVKQAALATIPGSYIKFRCSSDSIIPYVEIPLTIPGGKVPLVDVILGPASHPSADLGMNMFLSSLGYQLSCRRSQSSFIAR